MEKEVWENSDAEPGGIGFVATARKNDPRPIATARSKTMRVDVEAPERLAVLATIENPVPYIVLCCAIYPLSACILGEVAEAGLDGDFGREGRFHNNQISELRVFPQTFFEQ